MRIGYDIAILLSCNLCRHIFAILGFKAVDMSVKSVGGIKGDNWNIWSTGFISENFDFPDGGSTNFTVTAQGDKAFISWPIMKVSCYNDMILYCFSESAVAREYSFHVK